ncbi:MAG TPA: lipopolysaccharide heptosyltransferase I [Tepidisphaeraceae bacterium]|nr:lipopolysaccharide heptosyltransferase I [Tepidisphaeraceae bacterium]
MSAIALPDNPRILIVKPSALGDIVHTLPVLSLLRRRWPGAHISWLINPGFAGLIDQHPQINEVILFERRRFAQSWRNASAARGLFQFTRSLREGKFDLVMDLQGLFRSGWFTARTRAPVRVGFANARELAHLFYTHRVQVGSPEQHAVERYLKMAEFIGAGREPVEFHFATSDADRASIAAKLGDIERYAVLMPGTNWQTKRWPIEHFAAIVEPLKKKFGLDSIVAGGPDAAELAARMPGTRNLVGQTNLRELTALFERAALVIANDSGPMHIAAALGRPLVTPYGPTNPVRTGPFGRMDTVIRLDLPCSPCYSRTCSHQSCLKWLTIEPVIELAQEQMARAVS